MTTICAWCKKEMRGDPADPVVSHSMCQPCARMMEQDISAHSATMDMAAAHKRKQPSTEEA